jgi:hypothetical protein
MKQTLKINHLNRVCHKLTPVNSFKKTKLILLKWITTIKNK